MAEKVGLKLFPPVCLSQEYAGGVFRCVIIFMKRHDNLSSTKSQGKREESQLSDCPDQVGLWAYLWGIALIVN